MAKRARGRSLGRTRGRKSGQRKGSTPTAARPATPNKYAGWSVYDPATGAVVGAGGQSADRLVAGQRDGESSPRTQGVSDAPARPSRGFYLQLPVGSPTYTEHLARGCPSCTVPGYVERTGWPKPCKVLVETRADGTEVECWQTTAASRVGHDPRCTYFQHVEPPAPPSGDPDDDLPF